MENHSNKFLYSMGKYNVVEKTMADHALREQWISKEQHTELVYELPPDQHQGRAITREEAADILWKVFRSDECRVPHQLYEYDLNTEYRQTAWEAYTDKNFSNTGYGESFHQLFLNGVLAGSDAQTLDPRGNLTRAQACKIVSKALYSLAEIGTTLDPIWDKSDIEELTVGETKSGELSDYGGKNYCFEADKAGYYMVSTSADKYALYDAGGIRMEPVDEKDGKDVYMITGAQEMRLYTAGASGAGVTTTVEKAPSGYIAPQEVVFENRSVGDDGKKHYYIFDDHPEYVYKYHVLDSDEYDPTALMHVENLEPGVYTLFSGRGKRADDFENQKVFYNAVFYGTNQLDENGNVIATQSGKVKVNRMGFRHYVNISSWDDFLGVWYDFNNIQPNGENPNISRKSYNHLGEVYTVSSDSPGSFIWLDETYLQDPDTCMSSDGANGFAYLVMEFEVLEGSINLATVAYQDKYTDETKTEFLGKQKFRDCNQTGQIKSTYERLPTVKGVAETTQTVKVQKMEYVIDESVPDGYKLPFISRNQFFPDGWKMDVFTTNTSQLTSNNRWTTPESQEIPIVFKGEGIMRADDMNNPTPGVEYTIPMPHEEGWIFDSKHSRLTYPVTIPEGARIGGFAGKTTLEPNGEYPDSWSVQAGWLADSDFDFENFSYGGPESSPDQIGSVNNMANYHITQEFEVVIHNAGPERTFRYLMSGHQSIWIDYEVNGVKMPYIRAKNGELRGEVEDGENYTRDVFEDNAIILPANSTTTIKFSLTILNGANPTVHHAFVIDNANTFALSVTKDTAVLPDRNYIWNYPQN